MSFVSSSDGSDIDIGTITKTGAGTYKAVVTGKKIGQYRFVPKKDNNTLAELSATISVTAGTPVEKDKGSEIGSTFEADQYTIVADGAASSTLKFKAQDFYGNVVAGLGNKLTFDIVDGGGNKPDESKVILSNIQESPDGTYKATLKGTLVGTYKITPKVSSVAVGTLEAQVTLTAGDVDGGEGNSSFSADKTPIPADGTAQSTLTFKAKDTNQNPITGLSNKLTFDIVDGGGNEPDTNKVILSEIQETPAQSGIYVATLKGTLAGTYKITPKVSSVAVGTLEAEVTLTAGDVDGGKGNSSFQFDEQTIVAGQTATLTLVAKDKFGNPIDYDPSQLSFVSSFDGSDIDIGTITKAGAGTYKAVVTGKKIGQYRFVPKKDSNTLAELSATISVTAGTPVEKDKGGEIGSTFEADQYTIVADGAASSTLTFKAQDFYGNVVAGLGNKLAFDIVDGGGNKPNTNKVVLSEIQESPDGTYKATLKGTLVGTYKITPKVSSVAVGTLNVAVTLTAGKVDGGKGNSTFIASPTSFNAGDSKGSTLTFTAKDAYGNLVAGLGNDLTFDIVDESNKRPDTNKVVLSNIQETPAQSGIYVATLQGTLAGTYKITPKISSVAVGTLEATVTINGGNIDATKFDFFAESPSITADGSTESKLIFKARDAYSNPVNGLGGDIIFTIKRGTVVVTNGSTVNLSEVQETEAGTYIAKLKGTASGVYTVTLNLSGNASVTRTTQVTLTAGEIDESRSSLTSSASSVIADKTLTLTLIAQDKFGNPIDYDLSTLKFVDKNGNDSGVAIGEISKANVPGRYQATLTGVIAGDYEIVAKSGDTILAAGSAPVKVIFGDPVEKGKNNEFRSTIGVDRGEIVADGTTTAKLNFVAKDIYGNAVTGIKDKLKFVVKASPTGSSYTIGTIEVDGNSFSATFKGTTLGVYTIVPQYNSSQVGSLSVSITVKAGDVDTSEKTKSTFGASASSITANDVETITLTFKAKDPYNNPVSGLGTRLIFDIAIQNAGAPNDGDVKLTEIQETTAGSGVYTAKLSGHVANSYVIKPKVDGNNVGNLNVVVSLKAGTIDPDHSTFTIDSSEIVADTNTIITLEAKDKFGNIVKGVATQLQLAGTPALATGTLVSTTEPQPGIYKFKILGITAGTYKIVPKQNSNELTGLSVDLTIKAGAPVAYIYPPYEARSKFSADQGTLPADGVTNAKLTFVAIDKYKNPVNDSGGDIEFYIQSVSDGGNAATVSLGTKEANGNTYTNTFRATAAGKYNIYVKYKNADVMSVSLTVQPGPVAVLGENGEVRSTFVADSASVTFDDSVNFTLTLKDKYGNVITGIPNNSLNLLLTGRNSGVSGATKNNYFYETSTKGTYKIYFYSSSYPVKKPDSYTIVPQRLGTPISGLSATIQVSLGKPYKTDSTGNQNSTLTASPQSRTVSDTEFITLTFVAKDLYGNDLTGIANQLGLTGYYYGTFAKLTETETPGTYTATAQSTIVTSPTIYVTYNGNKITSSNNSNDFLTVNPSWTAGDPIDRGKKNEVRSTFSTSRTELEADGIDSLTLTFTAVDIFGNTIYNDIAQKLEFAVTSGNKDDLSFGPIVRSVNVYTVTVKSKTVIGEYQIVPKFNGEQIGSLSVSLKVVPAKIYEYNTRIELDQQSYSLEQDMKVTVTLKNKNSYMVVGRADWLSNGGYYGKGIVVDGGKIKDTDWTDNGDGTYTRIYTAWTSGERKSYIAIYSTYSIYSGKYTIKHGQPIAENSSIKVGNGNTSFTANGDQLSVAVTIRDIAGNLIQDGLDEFRNLVTVPENLSVYSSSSWSACYYGGVSYCRIYQATKVGSDLSVTLKLPGWSDKISSQTFSIYAGAASFSKSIIETDKNEYKVGETITITVRLFDSFGNIAPNALSGFFVDVQNATTSYPKNRQPGPWGSGYYPGVAMSAIINKGNGVFTAAFTAKTPGNNVKAIFSEYYYFEREKNNIYNSKYSSPFSIVSE
ncbi:invasin domain 3-containing protein [Bartonella choladocola]|uniref:invasin domain 3-containing protein n=1 Tax=Bartonella choladocola TaxID=2750995 RepID=UPI003B528E9B